MGNYVTTTSLLRLFPGLPQTSTVSGYSDTVSLIDSHIERAESLVNAYSSRRYTIPFVPAPPLIKTLAEDISGCYLFRSKFTKDSHNTSEWSDDLFNKAMRTLDLIKKGEIDVINANGGVIEERIAASKISSNTKNYQPFFDVDEPTSWRVDPNRLNDVLSARG